MCLAGCHLPEIKEQEMAGCISFEFWDMNKQWDEIYGKRDWPTAWQVLQMQTFGLRAVFLFCARAVHSAMGTRSKNNNSRHHCNTNNKYYYKQSPWWLGSILTLRGFFFSPSNCSLYLFGSNSVSGYFSIQEFLQHGWEHRSILWF